MLFTDVELYCVQISCSWIFNLLVELEAFFVCPNVPIHPSFFPPLLGIRWTGHRLDYLPISLLADRFLCRKQPAQFTSAHCVKVATSPTSPERAPLSSSYVFLVTWVGLMCVSEVAELSRAVSLCHPVQFLEPRAAHLAGPGCTPSWPELPVGDLRLLASLVRRGQI